MFSKGDMVLFHNKVWPDNKYSGKNATVILTLGYDSDRPNRIAIKFEDGHEMSVLNDECTLLKRSPFSQES